MTKEKIDWPVVIKKLTERGLKTDDIAHKTAMSKRAIDGIYAESYSVSQFDKVVSLMLMYKDVVGGDFPIIGEYYEGMDC